MSLFRELADAVREQMEAARQPVGPPIRPTSLREAGAVGGNQPRRPARDDATAEGPVPNDQAPRVRLRAAPPAPASAPARSRSGLMAALRSPASLRTAILVREVLDPPLALRDPDQANGQRRER